MSDVDLNSVTVEATPTITAGAYSAGDLIGGKITLVRAFRAARRSGTVYSVCLTDLAVQGADVNVIFFNSDPDTTTFTDNAALDVADADLIKIVGVAQLTSHIAFSDNGISQALNVGLSLQMAADGDPTTDDVDLFAAIVAVGSPTYVSTSDLTLRVGVLQD